MNDREGSLLKLVLITCLLGVGLAIYIGHALLWPHKTLVVKNQPMPIVGAKTLKNGETLTYHYDYCKYYDAPLSIQKSFIDGVIYTTDPTSNSTLQSGCHQQNATVKVPESLPAGTYRLRITTRIVVNQLRIDTITVETQKFTVVSPEGVQ